MSILIIIIYIIENQLKKIEIELIVFFIIDEKLLSFKDKGEKRGEVRVK